MSLTSWPRPAVAAAATSSVVMASTSAFRSRTAASAAASSTGATGTVRVQDALARLRIGSFAGAGVRFASVKSQGMYILRDSSTIPKKLGAKKAGDEFVIPGNIIYKQRGTKWFPGENCHMGRNHTIHASVQGYVKYYRDPTKHTERQYIGVVFDKSDVLPRPLHAMRRRKLGMVTARIAPPPALPALSPSGIPTQVVREPGGRTKDPRLRRVFRLNTSTHDYSYVEDPWRLGKLIRTKKHKQGSRRVAMRHRRRKAKIVLGEKRALRLDLARRRREAVEEKLRAMGRRYRLTGLRKKVEADGREWRGPEIVVRRRRRAAKEKLSPEEMKAKGKGGKGKSGNKGLRRKTKSKKKGRGRR